MTLFQQLARVMAVLALALALVTTASRVEAAQSTGGGPPAEASEHDPERILVAFRPGVAEESRAAAHAGEGARVENRIRSLGLDVVKLRRGDDPRSAVSRYRRNPSVKYAQLNHRRRLNGVPNDSRFVHLWGLNNTGQPYPLEATGVLTDKGTVDADVDAPEGWAKVFGAGVFPTSRNGVAVGVLDSGIDGLHEDLAGSVASCASAVSGIGLVTEGLCADDNGHGTHVAGTVAAIANNGKGVAGVAPNAPLAVFKAFNATGHALDADILAGIEWLARLDHPTPRARVVNMSFGFDHEKADACSEFSEDESVAAYCEMLPRAYDGGRRALLVAAAGNKFIKGLDGKYSFPASHRDVVSVGATNADDKIASFSYCNADVELSAPGESILSTVPATYDVYSGTSMATPHLAGVASMVMWTTSLDAGGVRQKLASVVDDRGTSGRDDCFGHGRVNLAKSVGSTPPALTPGGIQGTVTAHSTNKVIAGATVDCGSAGRATTSTAGAYSIGDVSPGTYTCTATATGYKKRSQSVTVQSGSVSTANFSLSASR